MNKCIVCGHKFPEVNLDATTPHHACRTCRQDAIRDDASIDHVGPIGKMWGERVMGLDLDLQELFFDQYADSYDYSNL